MLADDATIAAHPEALSRKVLDMNIVYCFYDNNNSVMNDGARVLGKNCLESLDLKEEDIYNAAINNIVDSIVVGEAKDIIPNTFVNFDVPDHSIVIGNPASIHHRDNATEGHIPKI